jgi:outer membrane protein OmpA-like peptidoglycan-associated protein
MLAVLAALLGGTIAPVQAQAQSADTTTRTIVGERYVPTIWVDPDGCEHWVMDDGAEGFMTPHVTRQGIPVCRRAVLCGVLPTDQFFATNSYRIAGSNQQSLRDFFVSNRAKGYIITGHTDARASDAYNLRLSKRRATSVARVARGIGANVVEIRGYGERQPRASNATSTGMAENRRVEILCVN